MNIEYKQIQEIEKNVLIIKQLRTVIFQMTYNPRLVDILPVFSGITAGIKHIDSDSDYNPNLFKSLMREILAGFHEKVLKESKKRFKKAVGDLTELCPDHPLLSELKEAEIREKEFQQKHKAQAK